MKKIILTIALAATTIGFAQHLESKIPVNAQAVISVSGENIFELISKSDFENNTLGKEMIKELKREDKEFNSLDDFGMNLQSKAFYFYQPTDSISYHNFIIKLNNRKQMESLLDSITTTKIVKTGNVSSFMEYDSNVIWNDNTLLFTVGEKSYGYFSEHEERFKKQTENEEEDYYLMKRKIT